ncbi:MAG: ribonuclease HII, partial [Thermoplasmatota archaeon]
MHPGLDVADGQGLFLEPARPARKRTPLPEAPARPGLTTGIDEAGRGPVIGPLVVAGVAHAELALFKEMGCKDSKLLTPARRKALDREIRRTPGVHVEVRVIEATVLDHERRQGRSLNRIEALRFRDIARKLGTEFVIVDAADVDAKRFGRVVRAGLARGVTVTSEHKADVNHPVVGAASIVAKVARDAAVAQLGRRLERRLKMPLGSGYSHDPDTRAFLAAWFGQFGDLPEGTRHTWATARDLVERAREGDSAARGALAEIGRRLGAGLVTIINVFDPELI